MIGRTIQNYRIEELLGEGGMGTVYRATDTQLRRPVALKMLHPHLLRDSTFMERFKNEAVLSAQLNHPNVATLYNLLSDRTDNLIVMELIDGFTIENLLLKQGRLSVETAVRIIMQALEGLQHAHNKGILHRDIKPANLMLTREGTVKLMDFGIARIIGSQRLTRADRVVGTLEYMAPELLNGIEPSIQSDLYAIGVLMYELLSGKMPFEPTTENTLINQILNKKPVAIRSRISDLPRSLEAILDNLLQKKPEKRFTKASELRHALAMIVPPAPLDLEIFETKKSVIPATQLNSVQNEKPKAGPTRLASATADKPTRKNQLKAAFWSLEGIILASALLIALCIIVFWVFWINKKPSEQAEIPALQKDSIQTQKLPKIEPKADSESFAQQNVAVVVPKKDYSAKPVETKPAQPAPKEKQPQKPVTKKNPVEEKVPDPPKELPKPIVKEEEKTATPITKSEPTKPVSNKTVELRGESFSVEFTQTVSSDASVGQTVWLRAVSSVVAEGVTVIQTGAKVRAKVVEAHPSSNSQRALLALRFEAVEAINGQWVAVKFPEYSDKSSDQVVFQQGRRVNNVRTTKTTLTISF